MPKTLGRSIFPSQVDFICQFNGHNTPRNMQPFRMLIVSNQNIWRGKQRDGADCVWLLSVLSHCTSWPWMFCTIIWKLVKAQVKMFMHGVWLYKTHRKDFWLPCLWSYPHAIANGEQNIDPNFSVSITSLLPFNAHTHTLANYRHFR